MHFGVDYYPEHWPEKRWAQDAEMMKDARFDTVRLAEFAWSKLEETEGNFDFSWLDRAIETLANRDLDVVLGTPTAAPPPWLTEKHPDVLAVNENKQVMEPGHRRHYCVNSEVYREHTKKIVSNMAEKYGGDDRVIGWQTDNELGHPVCYCDDCREKFRAWLREKYENLDELNRRWGTVFWSHEYTDWDQIPLPNDNPRKGPNPSLHLDYKRFFSQSTVEYNKFQADLIREEAGDQWVCHNFMPHFPNFDHFDMAEDLDLAAWDHYPTEIRESYEEVSAGHDLTYGVKDEPFWVMEQQCSYLTRDELTPAPRPGETRMWTYQSIAHGADGIIYFRWRPCRFGDEQFHGGVLQHDGSRKSPGYQEIKSVGEEFDELEEEIDGTVVDADVGIYYSFEQNWSMETYRYHSPIDYKDEIMNYYRALFEANVNVKFVSRNSDLSGLDLLIVPVLPMADQFLVSKFEEFVKGGGHLVGTFRAGIKDFDNQVTDETFPGRLSELFGIEIHEFTPVKEKPEVTLTGFRGNGRSYQAVDWVDCIETKEAKSMADYETGWPADKGFTGVTRNDYGGGVAYYVGLSGEEDFYRDLVSVLLEESGCDPIFTGEKEVEVRKRIDPRHDEELVFVVNHSSEPKSVKLDGDFRDLISSEVFTRDTEVEGFEVMVLKEK
ncbi:beta-galactosidase [Candidatus Bipolaricaulota bacterium]|nr:beta-galactosidase [Candidatus Bipolaricaulota bacterium]